MIILVYIINLGFVSHFVVVKSVFGSLELLLNHDIN